MTNSNITITICIPTYNRAMFLDQLLDVISKSLLRIYDCNHKVDVAISDNHSNDATSEVISKYEHILKITRNRNSSNIGPAANLLKVATLATGDYIWFISDDDVLTDRSVDDLVMFLSANKKIDYIFSPRILVDRNLNFLHGVVQPRGLFRNEVFNCGSDLFVSMNGEMPGILGFFSSTIIRRNLWEMNVEKYSRSMSEWSHLEILLQAIYDKKCAILKAPGILCRTGNARAFHANSQVWFDSYVRAFLFAKSIGYSSELCESFIQQLANSGKKAFVLDKILGHRSGSFRVALSSLGIDYLTIKKDIWYWASFIPTLLLRIAYPIYVVKCYYARLR